MNQDRIGYYPRIAVVTGAGGFIGRHLSRYLNEHGCDVRGIGHSTMTDQERTQLGIAKWFSGGISASALTAACKGAEIIYHCAGSASVPLSMREPMTDFKNNVQATAELLEFSRCAGGIPIVYLSTAGVYGKVDHQPIQVHDQFNPVSPYGMNKLIGEQLLRQYANFFSVPGSIVRLFSVYGEGLRKQLLWDASHKIHRGDLTFSGTGAETRDWIHIDDVVNLVVRIGASAATNVPVFHGASGMGVSIREILKNLTACYRIAEPLHFNGMSRPGDPKDYCADIKDSLILGWSPNVSLTEGVARYADWFLRDMKLGHFLLKDNS